MTTYSFFSAAFCFGLLFQTATAADLRITASDHNGSLAWSSPFTNGVLTTETATAISGPWTPQQNRFTTSSTGTIATAQALSNAFVRLAGVDISTNSASHFTNLTLSYGVIETIAGKGQTNTDHQNFWLPSYEGGYATNANLSQPHSTFADPANNLIVVDESSHSALKITPGGIITTFAGTHTQGFNGDGPAPATQLHLNWPNGGWMRPDGVLYILDTYNNRVRRVNTNGIMTTMIVSTNVSLPNNAIVINGGSGGRGLWMKSDESLAYFASSNATRLSKWTPAGGVTVLTNLFVNLGNVLGDEVTGNLYITDRKANRIYCMTTNGLLTPFAGNGYTTNSPGGGEGGSVLLTGLNAPRCICFLPGGSYFITEHYPGNRVWHVDTAGIIHLWLNGPTGQLNFPGTPGDGQWFYKDPLTPKVYLPRAITLDRQGNLILTVGDYGFIRRINFKRMNP